MNRSSDKPDPVNLSTKLAGRWYVHVSGAEGREVFFREGEATRAVFSLFSHVSLILEKEESATAVLSMFPRPVARSARQIVQSLKAVRHAGRRRLLETQALRAQGSHLVFIVGPGNFEVWRQLVISLTVKTLGDRVVAKVTT